MIKKIACLALMGLFAAPVFADPPSHAPAHGYRNKHQKHDNYDRYDQRPVYQEQRQVYQKPRCNNMAGAAIGGGLGGAVGSQVGTGTTNTIAIGAAAATGAIIGSQLDGCN